MTTGYGPSKPSNGASPVPKALFPQNRIRIPSGTDPVVAVCPSQADSTASVTCCTKSSKANGLCR
jgi:hypothetical protein